MCFPMCDPFVLFAAAMFALSARRDELLDVAIDRLDWTRLDSDRQQNWFACVSYLNKNHRQTAQDIY